MLLKAREKTKASTKPVDERQRKNDDMHKRFFIHTMSSLANSWGRKVKELHDVDNITISIVIKKKLERLWKEAPEEVKKGSSKRQYEYARTPFVKLPTDEDMELIESRRRPEMTLTM